MQYHLKSRYCLLLLFFFTITCLQQNVYALRHATFPLIPVSFGSSQNIAVFSKSLNRMASPHTTANISLALNDLAHYQIDQSAGADHTLKGSTKALSSFLMSYFSHNMAINLGQIHRAREVDARIISGPSPISFLIGGLASLLHFPLSKTIDIMPYDGYLMLFTPSDVNKLLLNHYRENYASLNPDILLKNLTRYSNLKYQYDEDMAVIYRKEWNTYLLSIIKTKDLLTPENGNTKVDYSKIVQYQPKKADESDDGDPIVCFSQNKIYKAVKDNVVMALAPFESANILSQTVVKKALLNNGKFHGSHLAFFLHSMIYTPKYLLTHKYNARKNDIRAYNDGVLFAYSRNLKALHDTLPWKKNPIAELTLGSLQWLIDNTDSGPGNGQAFYYNKIYLDLLNPHLLFLSYKVVRSLASSFSLGTLFSDDMAIPCLALKEISIFLPMIHSRATPHGPEYAICLPLKMKTAPILLYFSYGNNDGREPSASIALELLSMQLSKNFELSGKIHFAKQPDCYQNGEENEKWNYELLLSTEVIGFAATISWSILEDTQITFTPSYKTAGYIPGEPLYSGFNFQIGIQHTFS